MALAYEFLEDSIQHITKFKWKTPLIPVHLQPESLELQLCFCISQEYLLQTIESYTRKEFTKGCWLPPEGPLGQEGHLGYIVALLQWRPCSHTAEHRHVALRTSLIDGCKIWDAGCEATDPWQKQEMSTVQCLLPALHHLPCLTLTQVVCLIFSYWDSLNNLQWKMCIPIDSVIPVL